MKLKRTALLLACCVFPALSKAQNLPNGPGKDAVAKVCTGCHGVNRFVGKKMTLEDWQETVDRMVANGATPSPAETQEIVVYLNDHFGGTPDRTPAKAQPSSLSLAEARDLSGTFMKAGWYLQLNMGPRDNLPNDVPLRGINSQKSARLLLTQWSKDALAKYSIYDDVHASHCGSVGPQTYNTPYAFEFLQTPGRVTLLMEEFHEVRRIWLDGRSHPADPNPTVMGHSIGRWEEDTLVVDTVGFLSTGPRGETSPLPRSEKRHLTERIRRVLDGRVLEIESIDEDPIAFKEPLRGLSYYKKDPGLGEIVYHACEFNVDYGPHNPKKAK
jgi:hypothetical protein